MTIPFDVNDPKNRRNFLEHGITDSLAGLTGGQSPLWGNMSAQNMVEHLLWAFEASTGKIDAHRDIPEAVILRAKKFLFDNRPSPHEFKNPLLGSQPPPVRFATLDEAKFAFQQELHAFLDAVDRSPGIVRDHPIFGPLNAAEWERTHFKHCYHHLLQFGLIREK